MIEAYRAEDRAHGRTLKVKLIADLSTGVPKALIEVAKLGRTLKKRAAVISILGLLLMIAVEGKGVPASAEEAATHPYWGTAYLVGLVTFIWFLVGPAFAGRGKPM